MTLNNDFGSFACHKPKIMYCHECKEYTQNSKLFLIRRYNKQTFSIIENVKNVMKLKILHCLMIFIKSFLLITLILSYLNFFLMKLHIIMA